jgi:hypothetical protein
MIRPATCQIDLRLGHLTRNENGISLIDDTPLFPTSTPSRALGQTYVSNKGIIRGVADRRSDRVLLGIKIVALIIALNIDTHPHYGQPLRAAKYVNLVSDEDERSKRFSWYVAGSSESPS